MRWGFRGVSGIAAGFLNVVSLIAAAVWHKFHPYLLHPRKRLASDLQNSSVGLVGLDVSSPSSLGQRSPRQTMKI